MKKHIQLANEIREYYSRSIIDGDLLRILDKHAPIEKPFPKVMQLKMSGNFVLFYRENNGTYISGEHIGKSSHKLEMRNFKDCNIGVIS